MSSQGSKDRSSHQRISGHSPSGAHHSHGADEHDACAGHEHGAHAHHGESDHAHAGAGESLRDPVCRMKVTSNSNFHGEHGGKEYYFCSDACLTKFQSAPEKYVEAPSSEPAPPAPVGTIYTCPMHPEIRWDHPGQCPKCGMTLEPILPSL